MKLIKHISILFLMLATTVATAQDVKFQAKVSKKKLGINERLRIDFVMNEDGDNFVPPSFKDFNIIGGPNQSVSHSWGNGKRTFSKTYSYFLAPKSKGSFTIKQATIEVKGITYKTSPITVQVTKAIDQPKNPNDPDYIASENIHLVAEVSNANPYLSEAITVVYKLYVAPKTGVSNYRQIDNPEYNGFWSQSIDEKGLRVLNGQYKGEDYRYVVLRKAVLYPQKTGKLIIEPLTLDVTIDIPTKRRDIFGGRLMSSVHKTISANRRTINVKPLPEEGKPADFTGAVGEFEFNVFTSKKELNANESLQAKVEVSGKGNLKLFKLPKLKAPSSLEVYDPEHKETVRTNTRGMSGKISDSYTIVPQYKGKYPLPALSFSYFDLKTESYITLTSKEAVVNVLEGPVYAAADNNLATTGTAKQRVILSNDQFAFIKTETNFVPTKPKHFFKTSAFWATLFSPLLAIPLAIVFRRKREERNADVIGNKQRKADRLARKYLTTAKKTLGKKEAFYVALEKALHNYLKAKLSIETSDFSKDRIELLLTKRKVEGTVVDEFKSLLENCELARYTPITTVTMQQDYSKAAETISAIDKQIR